MKLKKSLLMMGLAGSLMLGGLGTTVANAEASSSESQGIMQVGETGSQIMPMSRNNWAWRYKVEDGKKYRRLYDLDREIWLTIWIPC